MPFFWDRVVNGQVGESTQSIHGSTAQKKEFDFAKAFSVIEKQETNEYKLTTVVESTKYHLGNFNRK